MHVNTLIAPFAAPCARENVANGAPFFAFTDAAGFHWATVVCEAPHDAPVTLLAYLSNDARYHVIALYRTDAETVRRAIIEASIPESTHPLDQYEVSRTSYRALYFAGPLFARHGFDGQLFNAHSSRHCVRTPQSARVPFSGARGDAATHRTASLTVADVYPAQVAQ